MTQAALEEREQALAEAAASASLVSGLQKEVEMLRRALAEAQQDALAEAQQGDRSKAELDRLLKEVCSKTEGGGRGSQRM